MVSWASTFLPFLQSVLVVVADGSPASTTIDDIVSYIGPTLERHKGCDLISVYPGAGVWSSALHDFLQPRSHILMEPDEELYRPFLEPLLKKKGTRLVPKSAIVWTELDQVLTPEYLPHQVEVGKDAKDHMPRNDTLLVELNLAMYPTRKFLNFSSLSRMVIYQLTASIRASSLFQKYGRVRMLIWVNNEEKSAILPRGIQQRKRLAIEGELSTEYIAEVVSPLINDGKDDDEGDDQNSSSPGGRGYFRDHMIDLESLRQTLVRMKEQGIVRPPGRETTLLKQWNELGLPLEQHLQPGEQEPFIAERYYKKLQKLESEHAVKPFDKDSVKGAQLGRLRGYLIWRKRRDVLIHALYQEGQSASKMLEEAVASGESERIEAAQETVEKFEAKIHNLAHAIKYNYLLARDQLCAFLQGGQGAPPILSWDRRPYEPLVANKNDFFPNYPCALLDIQPQAIPQIIYSGTQTGDIFELILKGLIVLPVSSVTNALNTIYPSAGEGIVPHCPSLHKTATGGSVMSDTGVGAVTVRLMNSQQMIEVLDMWMKWPFRPTFSELINRSPDDSNDWMDDEDGPAGSNFATTSDFH